MDDIDFIKIANNSKSMAYAAKLAGMSYKRFATKAKRLGCFNPNPYGKGVKKFRKPNIPLQEILEGKHSHFQSYKLKKRLIKEEILKDECSLCGWKEKPESSKFTPCELDHIDGNPFNHKLENLRILCPNCHSLTKTYRFRRGNKKV